MPSTTAASPRTETIDSLTSAKRAMTVGSRWLFSSPWAGDAPVERTVLRTQTNAVCLTSVRDPDSPDGSWLYWPAAADMEFHGDGFTVTDVSGNPMTYTRADDRAAQ